MDASSVLVLAEHRALARPLIDHFGMKRSRGGGAIETYESDHAGLAVSLGGEIGAATATAFLLGRMTDPRRVIAFHFGVALQGSRHEAPSRDESVATAPENQTRTSDGTLVLVNRAMSATGRRAYIPDILVSHELGEAAVQTVAGPVEAQPEANFMDLEVTGFFFAALCVLAPHQVCSVEAVPAARTIEPVYARLRSSEVVTRAAGIVEREIDRIFRLIDAFRALIEPVDGKSEDFRQAGLGSHDQLAHVASALKLTQAQYTIAERLLDGYLARNGAPPPETLQSFTTMAVRTKQERGRAFEQLKRRLSS